MPKIAYIKAKSTEDAKALFEEICKSVIGQSTFEVKRGLLQWKGKDKEVHEKNPTWNDVFILAAKIDLGFELVFRYAVSEPNDTVAPPPVLEKTPVVKELEKQAGDIPADFLNDLGKTPAFTTEPVKKEVDPKKSDDPENIFS